MFAMMSKRTIFTTVTPLPPYMPRDLVVETLHSHSEMIELNPLVIHHKPCKAPAMATADEFHCSWYELTDKVIYLPGGILSGNVSYKACFHDLPRGLQTHVYAPTGLDIKGKWSVCGNLPHEPREPVELGLPNAPREGLYLREDVDMRCNILMTSFVKKTLKKAHAVLVERLVMKADLQKGKRDRESMATSLIHGQSLSPPNPGLGLHSPDLSSQELPTGGSQDPRHRFPSPLASPYHAPDNKNGDRMSGCGSTSGGEPSIHEQLAEAPSGYANENTQSTRLSMNAPARPPKINDDYSRKEDKVDKQPPIAELA